ncbi:CLUMA_CG013976, isoform A [Clunio marinus]|uniref:CLUMA_CG013976, isoform A n=1 Tax=Clunio marinus TaxID=568069 RepID=A0A1J1IKF7_9DIPT|nr:CLUMA_CG013976, isoform A [Clunio marinus]
MLSASYIYCCCVEWNAICLWATECQFLMTRIEVTQQQFLISSTKFPFVSLSISKKFTNMHKWAIKHFYDSKNYVLPLNYAEESFLHGGFDKFLMQFG